MGKGAPRTTVDGLTARALRLALDRGRPQADATGALVAACRGNRAVATGALDRLERAYLAQPDAVIGRAVEALRAAAAELPASTAESRPELHLVAPTR